MCQGDWMCPACWTEVQEYLWFEEFEADGAVSDSAYLADSEPELAEAGSPTVCPPTDDTDIDFEEARSPQSD